MVNKIIKSPRGFFISNIETNPLATERIKVIFRARSRLGKILRIKRAKIIKIPRNFRLILFENNRPKVGFGFFKFVKIKK